MSNNNKHFAKLWGMPALLSLVTTIGLLSAIIGLGGWHVVSWICLSATLFYMVKYGWKFFK